MSKVHPAESNKWLLLLSRSERSGLVATQVDQDDHNPTVLTVWKRSSMSFQGTDGFTVFDQSGRLAFRVDNYSRKNSCALLLMDGAGKPLLTLKPQVFSFQHQWNAYKGDEGNQKSSKSRKVFTMRSNRSTLFQNIDKKVEAEVLLERSNKTRGAEDQEADFKIEGCFWKRNCKITRSNGEIVANISRKRVNDKVLLGNDVFSLVIQPGFDPQLAMAFVIALDRISVKPSAYTPVLCSYN